MVKDQSDSEKGNPLPPLHGLLFSVQERYSFMVECLLFVQWVVGSIPHGWHTELFLVPASAQQALK